MKRYCNVEPILHLLSDKDLLESVNVGAVLQALQHGLYNGEVAPVVHAYNKSKDSFLCSACTFGDFGLFNHGGKYTPKYCPNCGARMDEKEGLI